MLIDTKTNKYLFYISTYFFVLGIIANILIFLITPKYDSISSSEYPNDLYISFKDIKIPYFINNGFPNSLPTTRELGNIENFKGVRQRFDTNQKAYSLSSIPLYTRNTWALVSDILLILGYIFTIFGIIILLSSARIISNKMSFFKIFILDKRNFAVCFLGLSFFFFSNWCKVHPNSGVYLTHYIIIDNLTDNEALIILDNIPYIKIPPRCHFNVPIQFSCSRNNTSHLKIYSEKALIHDVILKEPENNFSIINISKANYYNIEIAEYL